MHTMTTCLGFNTQAEEAVNFYASIFSDLKLMAKTICGEGEMGGPPGSVRTIAFRMMNHEFLAVNGGPDFKFTFGISMIVNCDTQEEIDYHWEKLSADGGETQVCGWVKDKFGVFWQVVPVALSKMMSDPDQKKSQKVMREILKMKKLDLGALKRAYEN